jgi:prenyltransferase beta subunit
MQLQGSMEGGFMGRTNKLVDGCYSFWQGASFPLLLRLLAEGQQAQQGRHAAPEQAVDAAAAKAVAEHLLLGAAEAFVGGLAPAPPVAAAERALAQAQKDLDDVVDQSLQVDQPLLP